MVVVMVVGVMRVRSSSIGVHLTALSAYAWWSFG